MLVLLPGQRRLTSMCAPDYMLADLPDAVIADRIQMHVTEQASRPHYALDVVMLMATDGRAFVTAVPHPIADYNRPHLCSRLTVSLSDPERIHRELVPFLRSYHAAHASPPTVWSGSHTTAASDADTVLLLNDHEMEDI